MLYNQVPNEVSFEDVLNNTYSLSPLMYKKVQIKNKKTMKIGDLLVKGAEFQKGNEPGSQWYMKSSTTFLIRTKALQDFSYLVYQKGEAIIPVNPRKYTGTKLNSGDILLSKDSNIGEAAIVCGDECNNADFSGGIVRLNIKEEFNRFYIFAFLKHPIFKEQLTALCPKGATIKHAGDRWMKCLIAFPNQIDSNAVIEYVSDCVKMIMSMEKIIADKSQKILEIINQTLKSNQAESSYVYDYPKLQKFRKEKRLDAAIYCKEYEEKIRLIEKYKNGYVTPSEDGFVVIPGPSLEIKLLKTRIDSDTHIPGFYQLLLPTNLSEYGTVNKVQYIGTKRKLPLLKKGDVLFGEAGFQKGRSTVIIEDLDNCTTNAHGLYARREDGNLKKSIFFRCIFDWYRNMGLIDLMAVGGSGGHFSPDYFEYIKIPKFEEDTVDLIVSHYSVEGCLGHGTDIEQLKMIDLKKCGILQIDKQIKVLKKQVNSIIDKIIKDEKVVLN